MSVNNESLESSLPSTSIGTTESISERDADLADHEAFEKAARMRLRIRNRALELLSRCDENEAVNNLGDDGDDDDDDDDSHYDVSDDDDDIAQILGMNKKVEADRAAAIEEEKLKLQAQLDAALAERDKLSRKVNEQSNEITALQQQQQQQVEADADSSNTSGGGSSSSSSSRRSNQGNDESSSKSKPESRRSSLQEALKQNNNNNNNDNQEDHSDSGSNKDNSNNNNNNLSLSSLQRALKNSSSDNDIDDEIKIDDCHSSSNVQLNSSSCAVPATPAHDSAGSTTTTPTTKNALQQPDNSNNNNARDSSPEAASTASGGGDDDFVVVPREQHIDNDRSVSSSMMSSPLPPSLATILAISPARTTTTTSTRAQNHHHQDDNNNDQEDGGAAVSYYRHVDHLRALRLHKDDGGWYYSMDSSNSHQSKLDNRIPGNWNLNSDGEEGSDSSLHAPAAASPLGLKEYCTAVPTDVTLRLLVGLSETTTTTEPVAVSPVRTFTIRIRPDVLCGAVMDAVHHAVQRMNQSVIQKRQGGHLRAVLQGGTRIVDGSAANAEDGENDGASATDGSSSSLSPSCQVAPPFAVDAQLCCSSNIKSNYGNTADYCSTCERVLLIRIYHLTIEDQEDAAALTNGEPSEGTDASFLNQSPSYDHEPISQSFSSEAYQMAQHLRECCALVQRIEPHDSHRRSHRPIQLGPESSLPPRQVVSSQLLEHYQACPSVQQETMTGHNSGVGTPSRTSSVNLLPALNTEDWKIIQSSSHFVLAVKEELENRDVTYAALMEPGMRFGAFPSLPTLDTQFCTQLSLRARDVMNVQLRRRSQDLEDYVHAEERTCHSVLSLLKPMCDAYEITAEQRPCSRLPPIIPLQDYPLDFMPPEELCPPWGRNVMEALNVIQERTVEANKRHHAHGHAAALPLSPSPMSPDHQQQSDDDPQQQSSATADADRAVQQVLAAFQKQNDVELSARLGRKNLQVMHRLAKIKSHLRDWMKALHRSMTVEARQASDRFLERATEAVKVIGSTGSSIIISDTGGSISRQVPLFKFRIVSGGGGKQGTFYVTAHHLLFLTHPLLPGILGKREVTLVPIRDAEIKTTEEPTATTTSKLLHPFPTAVTVHHQRSGELLYSCWSTLEAPRLQSLFDAVKRVEIEEPLD